MQTTKMDIGKFCNLKRLYELKVRSPNGFITAAVLIQWWIAGSVRTIVLENFGNIFLSDFFPAKLLNVLN